MIEQRDIERAAERFRLPDGSFERLTLRRDRKGRDQRIRAGAVGLMVAIAVGWWGLHAIGSTPPVPANPPEKPSVDLGIFEPVAGRIVFRGEIGLKAVDPSAPSVSTSVRLGPEGDDLPLDWSSDGTELLFTREDPTDRTFPYTNHLYILHADGTETQVTPEPVGGAAISPDGSRVVFAADGDGLYVVDAEGGQPVRIADEGEEPTFSPDGTQIAYLSLPRSGCCVQPGREHVWVANADGTDAHEILADEPTLAKGVFGLRWSPAGDRIAMENTLKDIAIYTFAPDGSDFTQVISGGMNPFWSPDGSQIAYMVPYDPPPGVGPSGLAIANADGSNVREFGFGSSGPWHPGTLEKGPEGEQVPAAVEISGFELILMRFHTM